MAAGAIQTGPGPECREQVRFAAHQLFEEKGLHKTSVREIAKSAGYTTGAVYFHYDSKEAIYSEILLFSLKSLTEQVIQASEEKREPFSALIASYLAFYRFYSEASQKLNFDVFFAESDINSAYLPKFTAEFEKINRCFEKNM
ncbi:MAG: TetR/AcrR family transcriptional regulator, partial [Lentilitoribacter sp.]